MGELPITLIAKLSYYKFGFKSSKIKNFFKISQRKIGIIWLLDLNKIILILFEQKSRDRNNGIDETKQENNALFWVPVDGDFD